MTFTAHYGRVMPLEEARSLPQKGRRGSELEGALSLSDRPRRSSEPYI